MTNNIEQIEGLLRLYGTEEYDAAFYSNPGYSSMASAYRDRIMDIVKSMQSKIDNLEERNEEKNDTISALLSEIDELKSEGDADESRESESL